ncbi:MAG: GH3 auxin-responsive promoter family protein [Candidatus Omnitrophica bacterium]|nr:GH3 auxin-responsive promoter family protein [Candidatus Omnitrophota bacterium]
MSLASIALNAFAINAMTFENSTKDPLKAQERTLLKYLRRNRNTEFGIEHGFASIKSIRDFRSRVSLSKYEKIRPYITRMENGENNILTRDKVVFFGITSGTTGKPKLIPVTKYSQDKKAGLMALWAYYLARKHPKVIDGKVLAIISPEVKNHTEAGIPYGPEDGHAYNNLPPVIKKKYVLPYELFYIENYDARYYCILRIAIEHNISTIATLNPSTLVILCDRIELLKDRIIKDIAAGTLDNSLEIEPEVRRIIEKKLKPNPKRAKELKTILDKTGSLLPKDVWPALDLIECWKGGTVKAYLRELPRYFGDVDIWDFGCLSTEARSSIPMTGDGAGSVLAIETNFYEFIPKEDIDKEDKRVLLCNELEKGKEYLLVVTTPGGLYRYDIDDVVRVDGFFNKTPIIEFVQKGHNAVSLTGEKVYEAHVIESVMSALNVHKLQIISFSACTESGNPPRYVFLVEFSAEPSRDEKMKFLSSVEKELCIRNSEYDDIRKQFLLGHPILKVVKKGEFERYRRGRVSLGAHDSQFKLPKLCGQVDFDKNFAVIEEIAVDVR